MAERYAQLSRETRVFRLARRGGGHLPAGQRIPKPEWLEPTDEDKRAGESSGRRPGLSVWDVAHTSVADALWFRDTTGEEQEAFAASVEKVCEVGRAHAREVAVVSDPVDVPRETSRWTALSADDQAHLGGAAAGHSLIEGISRTPEVSKLAHKSFRADLAEAFEPHS